MTIEVTAEDLATHLNLSADELDESTLAYLGQLSAAAETIVFSVTGDFSDAELPEVPADVRLAIMLLAAHFYANREATAVEHVSTIPFGVREIVEKYQEFYFGG